MILHYPAPVYWWDKSHLRGWFGKSRLGKKIKHQKIDGSLGSQLVDDIKTLRKKLDEAGAKDSMEFVKKSELKNMLLVGEAVARSALLRKESRGAHFREDFPDEGRDVWIKNTRVKKGNRGMEAAIN
jgi:succinate dehydrogenase/fumarate reductase flavoprotein subunit